MAAPTTKGTEEPPDDEHGPATGAAGGGVRPAPGTEATRRFRPRLRYELLVCAWHGHELVGTDAARVGVMDALYVREEGGLRWYRCLRCDSWLVLAPPSTPTRQVPAPPQADELPLRGRPLRDRFVLRGIALERLVHLVVLGALDGAIFAFVDHRRSLKLDYEHVLADLQGGLGGPLEEGARGTLSEINRLFAVSSTVLVLLGVALACYCAVLVVEMVGLWWAKRWAEYLTFGETGALVPFELYEMASGVTVLKACGLALNVAILSYLAWSHRLLGLRGGAATQAALQDRDRGWAPIVAATPALVRPARPAAGEADPPVEVDPGARRSPTGSGASGACG